MALGRRLLGSVKTSGAAGRALKGTNNFISVTQTNDITSLGTDEGAGADRVLFATGLTGTTPVVATNNSTSTIVYTPATGRFTVAEGGDYYITVNFICKVGAATQYDVRVKVNSSIRHTKRVGTVQSSDPDESTTSVILSLAPGDIVEITYEDDGTVDVFPNLGTTVNILRFGNVRGGGGPLEISDNVNGYLMTATGNERTLKGINGLPALGANTVVTGSYTPQLGNQGVIGDFSSLYFDGINEAGAKQRYQLVISGGMLQTIKVEAR